MRDRAAEEAEDRRLLYVAVTRAADAAVVSAAGGTGRYLDLLAPGLARAGVDEEARSFDPDDARWPSPPVPAGGAWTAAAPGMAEGPAGSAAQAPRGASREATTSSAVAEEEGRWALAQAWVDAIAPELAELVGRLRADERVPAPRVEAVPAPDGGRPLLTWAWAGGRVALLEPGAAEDEVAGRIAPDPGDPDATARRLLRALGDAAG
jgi:hypothetical protein